MMQKRKRHQFLCSKRLFVLENFILQILLWARLARYQEFFSFLYFLTGTGWHQSFHFFLKPRLLSSMSLIVGTILGCCASQMLRPDASFAKRIPGLFVGEPSVSRKLKILSRVVGSPGTRSFTLDEHERLPVRLSTGIQRLPGGSFIDPCAAHRIPFSFFVESSAICIPGMIARCRRLRARFRPISSRGIRTSERRQGRKR